MNMLMDCFQKNDKNKVKKIYSLSKEMLEPNLPKYDAGDVPERSYPRGGKRIMTSNDKKPIRMLWPAILLVVLSLQCRKSPMETNQPATQASTEPASHKDKKKDPKPQIDPRVEKLVVTARIQGATDRLDAMLRAGADANAFNRDGINALMAALLAGRIENAKFLIKHGADPKKKSKKGENAVSYALFSAKNQSLELIRSLGHELIGLDRKALVRIACLGDHKTLRLALIQPGQINFQDQLQETALIHATRCRNRSNVKFLVKSGADLDVTNDRKRSPLMVATIFNHQDIARFLLSNRADTSLRDHQDRTALDYAVLLERKRIERLLRQSGKPKN